MILIPLVVVPCTVLVFALVALLDRAGVLPQLDGGGARRGSSGLLERTPRAALSGALVLMGAWVLAWVVLLIVGLGALAA